VDALKKVDDEAPDLILMDIQLPGLDGLTVNGYDQEEAGNGENSDYRPDGTRHAR
jgi:CheY-like chemotaxis protein